MRINVTVPDGISGEWRVESYTVTQQESNWTRIRAIQHPHEFVPPGDYKRLMRNGTYVMTNTPMEIRMCSPILRRASGSIHLSGLGLGVVLAAILKSESVRMVTLVEKNKDVIALVGPHFKDSRVEIIHADAFDYTPQKGERYNAVWHDIWDTICADNLPQMTKLKRKWGRFTDWQGCWSERELKHRGRW